MFYFKQGIAGGCLLLATTITSFAIQPGADETMSVGLSSSEYKRSPKISPPFDGVSVTRPSIHKHSAASDALMFSSASGVKNLGIVNQTLAFESIVSMKELGSIKGETPPCPATVFTDKSDSTAKRSTCPWYYVIDHDPNRFPTTMLKAQTPCQVCIGSTGQHQCVGITHSVTVLMKSDILDSNGNSTWIADEKTITVGFTCAGRKFTDNSATVPTATTEGEAFTTPVYD